MNKVSFVEKIQRIRIKDMRVSQFGQVLTGGCVYKIQGGCAIWLESGLVISGSEYNQLVEIQQELCLKSNPYRNDFKINLSET